MSRVGVVTICDGRIVSRQCCACSQHAHGAAMKPMSLGDIFRPLGHVCARDASCDTLISARHPDTPQTVKSLKVDNLGVPGKHRCTAFHRCKVLPGKAVHEQDIQTLGKVQHLHQDASWA